MLNIDEEREAFEAFIVRKAIEKNYKFMEELLLRHTVGPDGYRTTWVDMAWMGWRACAMAKAGVGE